MAGDIHITEAISAWVTLTEATMIITAGEDIPTMAEITIQAIITIPVKTDVSDDLILQVFQVEHRLHVSKLSSVRDVQVVVQIRIPLLAVREHNEIVLMPMPHQLPDAVYSNTEIHLHPQVATPIHPM